LNALHCNGCIDGKGVSSDSNTLLCKSLVIDYTKKRIEKLDVKQWEKDISKFSQINYETIHIANDQRLEEPPLEKINEILKLIGKNEHNVNIGCTLCGYDTCYDFAVAVAQGFAKTEMCQSFALRNKQEYIKSLKTANDKLSKTQEALRDSEQKSRIEQQKAREASETINSMMQKLSSGVVIVDDKLRVIQSNRSFINMLGEDVRLVDEVIPGLVGADLKTLLPIAFYKLFTFILNDEEESLTRDVHIGDNLVNVSVFSIKSGKIAGAIIRDMYTPEVRKEEVVKRVEEVIGKNLEVVQQIAFLLGESASETERRLNSIIEFYKSEKQ
jgi:transcriptional regulator with PAS, ATPase and Fis domain